MKQRPTPKSGAAHLQERIIDREGDHLRVDVFDDTLFLEPEAQGDIIALDRTGVQRLRALCDAFLGGSATGPKPEAPHVTLTVEMDTSEAEARLAQLREGISSLLAEAEKLKLPILGGTTTVTNVAAQDPEATWETIKEILSEVETGRLTVGQGAVALRTSVTLIGHGEAQALLEPYAKEQVPRTPEALAERRVRAFLQWQEGCKATKNVNWTEALQEVKSIMEGNPPHPDLLQRPDDRASCPDLLLPETTPKVVDGPTMADWNFMGYPMPPGFKYPVDWPKIRPEDQRLHWWMLMSGGSMSDMSTEEDLRKFILNGGKHSP